MVQIHAKRTHTNQVVGYLWSLCENLLLLIYSDFFYDLPLVGILELKLHENFSFLYLQP